MSLLELRKARLELPGKFLAAHVFACLVLAVLSAT